jgi:adenosine deaminase
VIARIPARMTRTSPYRSLPKVELHCHLEATVRPETFLDLARGHEVPLPVSHPGELYRCDPVGERLGPLNLVCSVLETAGDFHRIAYESTVDAARAGIRYRELLVSPALHLDRGIDFETMWQGIDQGLAEAEIDCGLETRIIVDIGGTRAVAGSRVLLALVSDRPRDRLVGLVSDISAAGVGRRLAPLVEEVHACGLRASVHCGGECPEGEISALVDAGIDRIGHGTRLLDHPELVAEVVARGIPVTSCPSATVELGLVESLAHHPFARQRDAGVLVTLNSDVPAFLSFDLGDEYLRVADTFGFSLADMMDISLTGVEASWMDPVDKSAMARRFLAEAEAAGLEVDRTS